MVVIVGCSAAKLRRAAPAERLYVGTYFRLCRKAAMALRPDGGWWILSARHGLVHPATVVEPYDVTASDNPDLTRTVLAQVNTLGIRDAAVVVLAGAAYATVARSVWGEVTTPLAGLGVGDQRHVLSQIVRWRTLPTPVVSRG